MFCFLSECSCCSSINYAYYAWQRWGLNLENPDLLLCVLAITHRLPSLAHFLGSESYWTQGYLLLSRHAEDSAIFCFLSKCSCCSTINYAYILPSYLCDGKSNTKLLFIHSRIPRAAQNFFLICCLLVMELRHQKQLKETKLDSDLKLHFVWPAQNIAAWGLENSYQSLESNLNILHAHGGSQPFNMLPNGNIVVCY